MSRIICSKEWIDNLFKNNTEQLPILMAFYNLAYPNFNKVEKMHGFPKISRATNEYVFQKFISFDRKHHPDVMNGGLWMNNGFSSHDAEPDLPDWVISTDGVKVEWKEEPTDPPITMVL